MNSSNTHEYIFSPRALPADFYYSRQLSGKLDENNQRIIYKQKPKQKPKHKNSLETPQLAPKKINNCCVIL